MDKDSINEMERIQKGLERFLEQEVEGYQSASGKQDRNRDDVLEDKAGRREHVRAGNTDGNKGYVGGPQAGLHSGRQHGKQPNEDEEYIKEHVNKQYINEEHVDEAYADEEYMDGKNAAEDYNEEEYSEEEYDEVQYIKNKNSRKKHGGKYQESPAVRKERESRQGRKAAGKHKESHQAGVPVGRTAEESDGKRKKGRKNSRKTEISQEVSETASQGKKKSKFKRFLVILLILALILAGLWYYLVGNLYSKVHFEEIESVTHQPMKEQGVINILLIGNDSRTQGEDGRSDAMILLSISNKTKTIYMTSLLRDMYVDIPGHKGNRLNAAYSYGGAELLMETLEKNLDISVNRYVLVNFQAFANLVDAVGGVDLELTSQEVEYVNGYLVEYNILEGRAEGTDYLDTSLSGLIHLNGPQALAYCRNRYLGTDFGRTERQRKVLSAVIRQAPLSLITNPKGMADGLLPNLTTNLTRSECLELSLQAGKVITYDIVQNSIPIEGSYSNANIRGMAVLEVDYEKNKEFIRTNIYGKKADAGLFTQE